MCIQQQLGLIHGEDKDMTFVEVMVDRYFTDNMILQRR